jgi:putative ABC transport system permease protein
MLAFKLALKNLLGAGLRTWLNVTVLSIAFVIIVFYNGMLDGWNIQARSDTKAWETAFGQLWHKEYNPYDFYTLQDAHDTINVALQQSIEKDEIIPILITQATAYPQGRLQNILLKGIPEDQQIVQLPSEKLVAENDEIPAIIGKRMAESARIKKGDRLLIRWRDIHGTFDAREVLIVDIFNTNVPTVDNGIIWIPLQKMYEITGYHNSATMFIAGEKFTPQSFNNWIFKDEKFLMREIEEVIQTKKFSSSIISGLLLTIALLAIFDTQILSIFRRQKEIGTYIALGMTRLKVITIFTIEGSVHSILAILLGMIWGFPILGYLSKVGIPMPSTVDDAGMAIGDKIIPIYSVGMLLSTIILVIISATIVSYFPTRRISKLKPTDALRGKIN